MAVEIVVADTRAAVVRALQSTLGTFASQFRPDQVVVSIQHASVQDLDEEGVCFVNPGNCVGNMRGALDRALVALLPGVEDDVRNMINTWGHVGREGMRHLPLFSALLSYSNNRWMITAPCVFAPGPRNYRGTRNAFHATHAALSMLISANRAGMKIRRVVMPGVCTGHGRMNRVEAATQMADAFRAVFLNNHIMNDPTQNNHLRLMLFPNYDKQPE